jgi:hypothetical protein
MPGGRVVVVTGGSAGVGRATVRAFAERGDDVAVPARGRDGLEAAVKEIDAARGRSHAISVDVADAAAVERAAAEVEELLGPIDVWVNVGGSTLGTIVANKLAPGLLDRYLARTGFDSQQTQEPADANRPANLWSPVAGDHGNHGDLDRRATPRRSYWWLTSHRRAVVGVALGATGALALGKIWR